MLFETYLVLACSLFDWGHGPGAELIPGGSVFNLFNLLQHDWDEVDSLYLDHETMGV